MSKKKKHKKKKEVYGFSTETLFEMTGVNKKDLNKEYKKALKDIEAMQMSLYEADKKQDKKKKKKINKKEAEFYTSMDSLKARQKMSKKWGETGFLDSMIELLQGISPIIKILANALCYLLITFLSIDAVKKCISPNILDKISTVFNFAMAV